MHESTTMINIRSSSDSEAIGDSGSASLIILMIVVYAFSAEAREVLDSAVVGSLLCSTVGYEVSNAWLFVV